MRKLVLVLLAICIGNVMQAQYTLNNYTITYEIAVTSNPWLTGTYTETYTTEDEVILQDAVLDGYVFEGWYLESSLVNKITQINIGSTGDKNLYAKYKRYFVGDINENGTLEYGEVVGDIDLNGTINDNEIAGDINGNYKIDDNEISGDIDGSKVIHDRSYPAIVEISGDINGNQTIDESEIAGDINGNYTIDDNEIAGDVNGRSKIDYNEIYVDINWNHIISENEISGDINGNYIIDDNEIAGDINGNYTIDDNEISGDINGNYIIDYNEDDNEIAGDINGNYTIDLNEIEGDINGNYTIDEDEIDEGDDDLITSLHDVVEGVFSFYPNPTIDLIYSDVEVLALTISNSQGIIISQFGSNKKEYDVSNLESGVYFIECVGTNGERYSSKLIKK